MTLYLALQLAQLEDGRLAVSSYMAIKVSTDLNNACSATPEMWGSDVLITSRLLILLLEHETLQQGLNLTHRQDKHYIQVQLAFGLYEGFAIETYLYTLKIVFVYMS